MKRERKTFAQSFDELRWAWADFLFELAHMFVGTACRLTRNRPGGAYPRRRT